ncbi:MAG: Carbon monoxide dehydrogenase medium chain [Alphaproteobacteria bacterium MarineAlpha11_Bin1]|nr:MAG: Carbon monoxide dehydrogenase medium chain [Alphaproteobacteria bacterium MarineAlpha11_Bin1]|tara:strand:- start:7026 stop:7841 length:816 start_codon:yes stop_codon:yes gene_type:complete
MRITKIKSGWISRSHRAISPFRLVRPTTSQEAVEALSQSPKSTFIAGGIDLVRRMRSGDEWETIIDVSSIDRMRSITEEDGCIKIGALATHRDIETNVLLAEKLPDFQAAWTTIGNVRVRIAGTMGGNILAREASYDGHVILGVLDAYFVFCTGEGDITVSAHDCTRAFPAGGLLTSVHIPIVTHRKMFFDRTLKPSVSVAVSFEKGRYSIGIGCAFPEPLFQIGVGDIDATDISDFLPDPIDNPVGGSAYRRRMAGVLATRLKNKILAGI